MKIALIDIAGTALSGCLPILEDAGLEVAGSLGGSGVDMVRLIIRGEALPEECASGRAKLVSVEVASECYGRQRINRVSAITVVREIDIFE